MGFLWQRWLPQQRFQPPMENQPGPGAVSRRIGLQRSELDSPSTKDPSPACDHHQCRRQEHRKVSNCLYCLLTIQDDTTMTASQTKLWNNSSILLPSAAASPKLYLVRNRVLMLDITSTLASINRQLHATSLRRTGTI